jgi:hypothetical protein
MPSKGSEVIRSAPGSFHMQFVEEELDGSVSFEERATTNSWLRKALPKASVIENMADMFQYCGGSAVLSHVLWQLWIGPLWPLAGLITACVGGTIIYWNAEVLGHLKLGYIWYIVRIVACAVGVILVFI